MHRLKTLTPGLLLTGLISLLVFGFPETALAQENAEPQSVAFVVGTLWILLASALVFMMHLGFATLEAGLVQPKNTVNILFKNVTIVSMGILIYALIGFGLMYPGEEFAGAFFGFARFGIGTDASGITSAYNENYTYWADFLFHRTNPKGAHRERWMHAHGCRRWFNVERDTVSHVITAVYEMGKQPRKAKS